MEVPVDPADPAPGSRSFLERRSRELIARRFPLFALGWLATMALWLVVFALEGRFTAPVVAIVGLQVAILAIAAAALRSLPAAPRVLAVTVAACVFLGVSSTALFASIHGQGEVLIFVLFSLHLAAALMFCWGWRAELALQVSTLVPYVLVLSAFGFLVPPLDLVAAATIGSLLSLAVAEGSARSLRFGLRGEASAAEMTRELAASRDAYRDLAENARDFIWTADLDGRLTYVNDAIARYQGLPPDQIIGRFTSEFITDHPENPDPKAILSRLMFGAMDAPLHVQGTTPQGPRWFEVLGSAVHAPDGTVVGVRAISRDVTERRLAAERLRESEERYRGLLESQRDIIIRFSFGETITFVNDAFCQTFGITREEAIGSTGAAMRARLLHPDDLAASEAAIVALLRPPHRGSVENRNRTPEGWRWFSWETGAIRDARGRVVEVHAVGRDVTERKLAEEALRASEARYRGLVESAEELVTRFDPEGRLTFVNDSYCRAIGHTREELLGQNPLRFVHEDERAEALAVFRAALTPSYRRRLESRGLTPEGWRWFEWEVSGVRGADDRIVEIQQVGREVTARKQAEAALRESEERFRSAFEDASIGMCVAGPEGQGLRVNHAFCDMLGYSEAEMLAMNARDITHPDDLEATIVAATRVLDGAARSYQLEKRYLHKRGHVVWTWVTSSLVRDAHGAPLYFIAQMQDVSERKLAEEALRTSLAELRRGEEKLRLLAQHQATIREEERKRLGFDLHDDVCQELVGVGILVESLRRKMAPMPAEHAAEFDRVVGYLGEVVEHLRLLARELRPMLLRDLGLDGSLRSLADGMCSATTRVATDFRTPIPRLDEEAEVTVYRIAQEALANATRHAGARSIVVSLAATDGRLCLEVQDDGCGFDPAAPRAEALGLVSMEERAQALGGRLELKSAPGAGTTVRLECPATRAPASAA